MNSGVCPAPTRIAVDGTNNGYNAGRICWAIAGTFCEGEVQGTFCTERRKLCETATSITMLGKKKRLLPSRLFYRDKNMRDTKYGNSR